MQAYKLVSMAASSFSFGTDELRLPSSLRDTAYWFPTVPEESLCLNEKSFTGNALKKSEYEVLFWLPFGRKNGTGLKHIDGFLFSSGCNQSSIEIEYDDESDSDEDDEPSDVDRSIDTQSFRPYLARRLGLGEFDGSHGVRLDSGDGERLKSITVFDYKGTKVDDDLSIKHGTLCGFLVSRKYSLCIGGEEKDTKNFIHPTATIEKREPERRRSQFERKNDSIYFFDNRQNF